MSSRKSFDTDTFDVQIERYLRNWLAQTFPSNNGKEKLLSAASSAPVRRSRLNTFQNLSIQGFFSKCFSLYCSIFTQYPQYPEMNMHMIGPTSDILPLSVQLRIMHSLTARRGLIFLLH